MKSRQTFSDYPPLGSIPDVNPAKLEEAIAELEAQQRDLAAGDDPEKAARMKHLQALLRNRQNLLELIKAGRFV